MRKQKFRPPRSSSTTGKEIYLKKKEEIIKQKNDFTQKKSVLARSEIKSFVAKNGTCPRLGGKSISWYCMGGVKILYNLVKNSTPLFFFYH